MHERVGRRPKLTPQLEHQLCELIAQGVPICRAIRALEVSETAVYRWLRNARRPAKPGYETRRNPLYERFADSLDAAFTEREARIAQTIERVRSERRNGTSRR